METDTVLSILPEERQVTEKYRGIPVVIPRSFVFVSNETIIKDLGISVFRRRQDIAGQKYLITRPSSNLAESERE